MERTQSRGERRVRSVWSEMGGEAEGEEVCIKVGVKKDTWRGKYK